MECSINARRGIPADRRRTRFLTTSITPFLFQGGRPQRMRIVFIRSALPAVILPCLYLHDIDRSPAAERCCCVFQQLGITALIFNKQKE